MYSPALHSLQRTLIRRFQIALVLVVLLAVTAGALAEAPVIDNTRPRQPTRTIELEEMWSVGGEDGDLIFGMMIDAVTDAEGNIYLLDSQLCHVEVISADGEHLRTISGEGDGPGEVRMPQDLVMMSDGNLGIMELFPAKFVRLTLDGTPAPELTLGGDEGPQTGFSVGFQCANRGGTIMVAAQHSTQVDAGQARTQYLARLNENGEEVARYCEANMVLNFQTPKFVESELLPSFLLANTVDDRGRVYAPLERNEYAIAVYNPDGSIDRVIKRSFENWKRDARDRRRLDALIEAWLQGFPGEMERDIEDTEPAITDLHVDDRNVLWVQHSRSGREQPDGVFLTYDTFDGDGNWLQEVSFRGDGNGAYDGLIFLDGDRVLLVRGYALARWASRGARNADFGEEEEVGPMEIVCCRMSEI